MPEEKYAIYPYMDDRITKLETQITFQEQLIEDLNEVVIAQQKQLELLSLQYKMLADKLVTPADSGVVDISLEVPPPHY